MARTGLRPIALRHEGFGSHHGLESDKKNDQVGPLLARGPAHPPRLPSIAIRQRPADHDMAVTMAQGMKRLGTPIAALLGVMLIGLIAISWLINRDALRNAVEAQI